MNEARVIRGELLQKAGCAVGGVIVNDNDKSGRWGWIEYGAGIGEYKDGSLFGYMNLIDNRDKGAKK